MSRKLLALSIVIVGLHIAEVMFLGTSAVGALLANTLQTVACGICVAMALGASIRGRGLSRPFWLLLGLAAASWGIANLGWMYYENWLHTPIPDYSIVRFIFDAQGVFFTIALFLDKDRDSARFDLETLLDSLQITMVFFCVFFGLYYLEARNTAFNTELFMVWTFQAINVTLPLLAGIQVAMIREKHLKSLYLGLTIFLLINAAFSGVADYVQSVRNVPTGTFYDLGWTLPFLAGALWASQWKESEIARGLVVARRRKTLGELALQNVMLALAPLLVLVLVAQLGGQWRYLGFALLGVSITCYGIRLSLSEVRKGQAADTVRRDTLAMDSAIDGMAILNPKGEHIYANAAFARMVGQEDHQRLLGMKWEQVYDPRDVRMNVDEVRKAISQEGKWSGPILLHQPDGVELPIEMSITRLPDGGVVCVSRDVRDRRDAENARFRAETKYKALVERVAAVSYIAEIGMEGQWLYVSPQIEAIFGFSVEEWLRESRLWMRHVHADDHGVVEMAEEACKRGERFQAEYRLIRKDGRVIWVSDTAVPVSGADSQNLMEGIIVDITDRKLLEGQLQQKHRMEAVGRLAGGIAHDFNNLLTIIKGYTELALTRNKVQPELRSDIERIEDASERAAALVRQLLAFSRRQIMQPKILDLNAIVVGLDRLLRRLMDGDIEMRTVADRPVGAIKADPGQIEQVIMNLVVNARDAMPSGGRLIVETCNVELDAAYARDHESVRAGPYVMLAVSDTGVGMSAETVAHIFEPFYTTKESGRGTGLGLSTVYGIVKQSGGYIWVYSEPGKGTTFKVYLPHVDAPIASPSDSRANRDRRKGTETILLVEDDAQVRELTRTALAAHGYFIIEAATAQDAERLCLNVGAEIHLLLTDVIMPGMSGHELAKRLTVCFPKMRVLYMSGYTYNVIAEDGNLESGVAFLQKPFTPSVLADKVREVLDTGVPVP
jgi:two-component system, cell cycle sensor histidine kinase and response regulator CckA